MSDDTAGFPAAEATQAIAAAPAAKATPLLWNGKPVRFRFLQQHAWTLLLGTGLAVALVAGFYDAITQVDWHVHIGPVQFQAFPYLKPAWDRGSWWPSFLGHWKTYRDYAFRNQLQPALAVVAVLSLAAGPAYWGRRCPGWEVALRAALVVVLGVGLGILGVWLDITGLPAAWAHAASATGNPGYTADRYFQWAGRASLFTLIWGIVVMGLILRKVWGPAGATIQGYWTDRLADRGKSARHGLGKVALYVRWPLTWPTFRERYSELYLATDNAVTLHRPRPAIRWAAGFVSFILVLLIALGATGRWYVGQFHNTVPYLFPPKG